MKEKILTSRKRNIHEEQDLWIPSPFSDNGQIMTGEKSRLVNHDMWILAGEPYFTKPVLLTALRSLWILFYISRSQYYSMNLAYVLIFFKIVWSWADHRGVMFEKLRRVCTVQFAIPHMLGSGFLYVICARIPCARSSFSAPAMLDIWSCCCTETILKYYLRGTQHS